MTYSASGLEPLGKAIEIKHGFAFKGEFIRKTPPGSILVTPGNFEIGGGFKTDKFKYYDGPIPEDYVLECDDLIVTMTDLSKKADTLGCPALVPKSVNGEMYLHNQRIGLVELKDPSKVDKFFLYYLMCTEEYRQHVVGGSTGTTVKHTSPTKIRKFETAFPKLETQILVGRTLRNFDKNINVLREMNVTLEDIARSLFQAWFVDFEPVRAKAAGATTFRGMPQELFDALPNSFEDSEIGEIPKEWQTEILIQQANWVNGAAYKNMHFSSEPDALPVVKITELKKGVNPNTKFTNTDLGDKYRISTGELLFSWSGSPDTSIDAFIWANGDAWLNQHVFAVRPNGHKSKGYLFALLKHLMPKIIAIAKNKQTTGLGHVTRKDMERMHICSPPDPYLSWFSNFVGDIYARILKNSEQIETLSNLRDTLLPKLISGEIEAPDLEALADGG